MATAQGGDTRIPVPDELREMAEAVSNWGRWGDDDELGTLNYVTEDVVARAAATVRRGAVFSLSVPIDAYGPQGAHGFRRNPIHLMSVDGGDAGLDSRMDGWGGISEEHVKAIWRGPLRFNDDFIIMPLQAGTQWDSLAHVYYEDRLYNGYPADSVTSFGATRDGIDSVAERGQVVTRGVLLDVARHRGVEQLAPQTMILPDELDAVAAAQGVTVSEGDMVLIRTGWWQEFLRTRDGVAWNSQTPGVSWRCAEWLHRNRVAAIAADNLTVEGRFPDFPGIALPFHMLTLRDMGMLLGEIWNLDALAADCAADGRYEFLVSAPPLWVTGGVGSPINPIAIK